METTKQAISLNEQPKTQAEALADLPVTAEQAQQIAGGTDVIVSAGPGVGGHVKVFNGATGTSNVSGGGSSYVNNHNETVAYDETDLDELADLLLTDEQEADIKGGCLGCNWGPPTTNHNETVAEDETEASEALADLPVGDAEQVKGGPVVLEDVKVTSYQLGVLENNNHGTHVAGTIGAVGNANHNETISEDKQEVETETLADLPVKDEEQVKAGAGTLSGEGKKVSIDFCKTDK